MSATTVATPGSIEAFVQALQRSGLLNEAELDTHCAALPKTIGDADRLAEYWTSSGVLTHFQATTLRRGIWQGLVLGPYHILAPVGRGGVSTVYLAADRHKNRLVALKVLPKRKAEQEVRTLIRFRREMDLCQRVRHPHIMRTYTTGVIEGVYFIAMEYIRGQTLTRVIHQEGHLSVERTARLFVEVADALAHAHAKGLIHRDLKPSNIMITPKVHAKLLDLGMALAYQEDQNADQAIVGGRGYVLGTMDYIAPEQVVDSTRIDGRADLYAMGCSMYHALTGQPPFPEGTAQEKMRRHRKELPPLPSAINPVIPIEFARIVDHLMAKSPRDRYASAEEVMEVLHPWARRDRALPMDPICVHITPAIIQEAERAYIAAGGGLESVPMIGAEASQDGGLDHPPASAERAAGWPVWLQFLLVFGGVLLVIALTFGLATWLR